MSGKKVFLSLLFFILILILAGVVYFALNRFFPGGTVPTQTLSVSNLQPKVEQPVEKGDLITGKAEPGSKVVIEISPGNFKGELVAAKDGTWKYTIPKNIESKSYFLTVINFDKSNVATNFKSYRIKAGSGTTNLESNLPKLPDLVETAYAQSQYLTVEKQNSTSYGNTSKDYFEFSHTLDGFNRYLIIGVAVGKNNVDVSSVFYGDVALERIGFADNGQNQRSEIWGLLNPARGTASVKVRLTGRADATIIATSWTGVNRDDPYGEFNGSFGFSSTASTASMPSESGNLVVDMISVAGATINPVSPQSLINKRAFGQATGGMSTKPGSSSVSMSWNLASTRNNSTPVDANWAIAAVSLKPALAPSLARLPLDQRDRELGLQAIGIYLAIDIATGAEVYVTREEFEREVCFYEKCVDDPAYDAFVENIGNHNTQYILALGDSVRQNCYTGFEAMKPYFPDAENPDSPIGIFSLNEFPSTYYLYNPYPNCGPNDVKRTMTEEEFDGQVRLAASAYPLDKRDPFWGMVQAHQGPFTISSMLKLFALTRGYTPTTNEETKQLVIDTAFAASDIFGLAAFTGRTVTQVGSKVLSNRSVLNIRSASPGIRNLRNSITAGERTPANLVDDVVAPHVADLAKVNITLSEVGKRLISKADLEAALNGGGAGLLADRNRWLGTPLQENNRYWVFGTDKTITKIMPYRINSADTQKLLDGVKTQRDILLKVRGQGTKLADIHYDFEVVDEFGNPSIRGFAQQRFLDGKPLGPGFGDNTSIAERIQDLYDFALIQEKTGVAGNDHIMARSPFGESGRVSANLLNHLYGPSSKTRWIDYGGDTVNKDILALPQFLNKVPTEQEVMYYEAIGEIQVRLLGFTDRSGFAIMQVTPEMKKLGYLAIHEMVTKGKSLRQALEAAQEVLSVQVASSPNKALVGAVTPISISQIWGSTINNSSELASDIALTPVSDSTDPISITVMNALPGGRNCVGECSVTIPQSTLAGNYNILACTHLKTPDYDNASDFPLSCVRKPITIESALSNVSGIYLKMDEETWVTDCSTKSVIDSSGNNHNGKSCPAGSGATGGVPGISGKAGGFDGINDFVQVDSPTLPVNDFTYSVWVNLNYNNDETILMASNGAGIDELQLYIDPLARLVVVTNAQIRITTDVTIPKNKWTHVVVTRKAGLVKAYINSSSISQTATDTEALNFSSCPLLIGIDANAGCNGFLSHHLSGRIDDLRVYDYAISDQDVVDIYKAALYPVSVTVGSETKTIAEFQQNPFNVHLTGTAGVAQKFVVPVVVNYSDGTIRSVNYIFDYQPTGTPEPVETPKPCHGKNCPSPTIVPTATPLATPTPFPTPNPWLPPSSPEDNDARCGDSYYCHQAALGGGMVWNKYIWNGSSCAYQSQGSILGTGCRCVLYGSDGEPLKDANGGYVYSPYVSCNLPPANSLEGMAIFPNHNTYTNQYGNKVVEF